MKEKHPRKNRLIRIRQVCDITGLGKTKIYELTNAHRFPQKVKIDGATFWSERAVLQWLNALIENQTGAAAETEAAS